MVWKYLQLSDPKSCMRMNSACVEEKRGNRDLASIQGGEVGLLL